MVNPALLGMVLVRPFITMMVVTMFMFVPLLPQGESAKKDKEE